MCICIFCFFYSNFFICILLLITICHSEIFMQLMKHKEKGDLLSLCSPLMPFMWGIHYAIIFQRFMQPTGLVSLVLKGYHVHFKPILANCSFNFPLVELLIYERCWWEVKGRTFLPNSKNS